MFNYGYYVFDIFPGIFCLEYFNGHLARGVLIENHSLSKALEYA